MSQWKLCRACLTADESFRHILFENVSSELYTFCTSLEVTEDKESPKALCNLCYELLTKFAEFKRMCIQSHSKIFDLITKANEKHESEIHIDIQGENQSDDSYHSIKVENRLDSPDCNPLEDTHYSNEVKVKNKKLQKRKIKDLVKFNKKEFNTKHRKRFTFSCEHCNRKFNYRERYEAHLLKHEGKNVLIQCPLCNKTFVTWNGLTRHNRNEHTIVNLGSLKCSMCGKIFKTQDSLKMHEKAHGNKNVYICDFCGKEFNAKVGLKVHLEIHNKNRERQFTCEHCGKKFFRNTILQAHVTRHHKQRRYICQICNFPFTEKANLAKHLLVVHEGKKLHKCNICSKSYASHSYLVEHKRIHSGERPFPCSYCTKRFLSRRRLNDHHKTHTGERPHKCGICDVGFTQWGTLKRHMKVHDRTVPIV